MNGVIMEFNFQEILSLMAAFVFGGLIGLEREVNGKPAGLRTNIIICVGAAAFIILAGHFTPVRADTAHVSSRIAAGIITGVGFLGGGVLIREGSSIHGLTTAASIWLVTSIGMACGIRQYAIAATVTAMALIVLLALSPLAHKLRQKRRLKKSSEDY